jgi:hypothetical protein
MPKAQPGGYRGSIREAADHPRLRVAKLAGINKARGQGRVTQATEPEHHFPLISRKDCRDPHTATLPRGFDRVRARILRIWANRGVFPLGQLSN